MVCDSVIGYRGSYYHGLRICLDNEVPSKVPGLCSYSSEGLDVVFVQMGI